jgi:hypothetical protein
LVDAGAEVVDCDGDGHVFHLKFVDRFHANVGENGRAGCDARLSQWRDEWDSQSVRSLHTGSGFP